MKAKRSIHATMLQFIDYLPQGDNLIIPSQPQNTYAYKASKPQAPA